MSVSLKRKLYPRGGSYETTIPLQLLLGLNLDDKNDAIFEYDQKNGRWYIKFEKSKNELTDKNTDKNKIVPKRSPKK